MKIAIVDDEKIWIERAIEEINLFTSSKDIIDTFESGVEFLKANKKYDVVFMDIEMNGIDGFDTLATYKEKYNDVFGIVLTTHTELSRKGYLVDAFRYIDKTNIAGEIAEALTKVIEIVARDNHSIVFENNNIVDSINVKEILFFETSGRSVILHTMNKKINIACKINNLEEELSNFGFFRCHKSYLINMNKADFMDKEFVYFGNGEKAYISVRKYMETKRKYMIVKKENANR